MLNLNLNINTYLRYLAFYLAAPFNIASLRKQLFYNGSNEEGNEDEERNALLVPYNDFVAT
jgi:hypothetical protein